ncbi:MAG: class I SAM-dependent methyltransferase [Syntrophaceae bacterium]|nr:class I SAM-dependent methyltransferase [Syntrophaceae bacterium]
MWIGYRSLLKKTSFLLERSNLGYRLSLLFRHKTTGPHGFPDAPWHNAVLKNHSEVSRAVSQVCRLGLPAMNYPAKNWDSLSALDLILKCTSKKARIFDAGGEMYSMILPWLFLYGYKNLEAGNLVFQRPIKKGPIVYRQLDITKSELSPSTYDAVTCLSVIEHGVNISSYFCEMARILKPGGILVTSTDYFDAQVDSGGRTAYGVPIRIFSKNVITEALEIASRFGFELTGPLDLNADEKVVYWKEYDLSYTFIVFSLRKTIST